MGEKPDIQVSIDPDLVHEDAYIRGNRVVEDSVKGGSSSDVDELEAFLESNNDEEDDSEELSWDSMDSDSEEDVSEGTSEVSEEAKGVDENEDTASDNVADQEDESSDTKDDQGSDENAEGADAESGNKPDVEDEEAKAQANAAKRGIKLPSVSKDKKQDGPPKVGTKGGSASSGPPKASKSKPGNSKPVMSKSTKEDDEFDPDGLDEDFLAGLTSIEDSDGDDEYDNSSLEERADEILAGILGEGEDYKNRLEVVFDTVSPDAFKGINFLIFSVVLARKRSDLSEHSFRVALQTNRKNILYSDKPIDINSVDQIEGESQEDSFLLASISKFGKLRKEKYSGSIEDFEVLVQDYIEEYVQVEALATLRQSEEIVSSKLKVGKKTLSGVQDAMSHLVTRVSTLLDLQDKTRGSGLVTLEEVRRDMDTRKENKRVGSFPFMPTLDNAFSGIRSGLLYVIMAPPKGGKTRYMVNLAHTAAVKHKTNVVVWPTEGGTNLFTPLMSAKHYHYSINKDVFGTDRPLKPGIDANDIRNKELSPHEAMMEQKFFSEFTSNPNYGSVTMVDNNNMYVEDFIDVLREYVRRTKSKMVIVDYLSLIESSNRYNTDNHSVIASAFQKAAKFAHEENIAFITPHQYRQEDIRAMAKGDNVDMRVTGSGSAEVLRSADMGIALWSSTEMLAEDRMDVMSLPTRFSKQFDTIPLVVDLGACHFQEIVEEG